MELNAPEPEIKTEAFVEMSIEWPSLPKEGFLCSFAQSAKSFGSAFSNSPPPLNGSNSIPPG